MRIGADPFCSKARNRDLYFSGTESLCKTEGAERKAPVSGGVSLLSRARRLVTALRFAPAETPVTRKPSSGLASSREAFAAVFQ